MGPNPPRTAVRQEIRELGLRMDKSTRFVGLVRSARAQLSCASLSLLESGYAGLNVPRRDRTRDEDIPDSHERPTEAYGYRRWPSLSFETVLAAALLKTQSTPFAMPQRALIGTRLFQHASGGHLAPHSMIHGALCVSYAAKGNSSRSRQY